MPAPAPPHPPEATPPGVAGRSVAFAKTTRPQLGAIVPRERLFARMDGTPGRAVVWISGPPGAGKTSLAASYVESRQRRCLWYALDADDGDVATFFHYFAQAALRLDAERIGALPVYGPEFASRLAPFARRFFRQALGAIRAPLTVVLDGLGNLPADSALFVVLEVMLGQVPAGASIIVTSRFEPPAALTRLLATGEMLSLGASMLDVAPEELVQIARLRGQELAPAVLEQLHQRTGGWAAGLVLMLEHAKMSGELPDWPAESAPRLVFDFLAGEIFDRFEPKMQQFLLKVACLTRLTPELAQALSGEPKAARLLLNLALNHYFVSEVRWQDSRGFQFHPLMRDFLLQRAELDLPEVLQAEHLRRAATLLRQAGHLEDAVALLLRAQQWDLLSDTLTQEAAAMQAQGRGDTLVAWVEALPTSSLDNQPALLLACARCQNLAQPRAARRKYERAFEAFAREHDGGGQLACAAGVVDALIEEFDDLAALDPWCATLQRLLREQPTLAGTDEGASAHAACLRASLWRPGLQPALAPDLVDLRLPVALRAARALRAGDCERAQALLGTTEGDQPPTLERLALAGLAALAAGHGELARELAGVALARAEPEGLAGHESLPRALAAAVALSAQDLDGARAQIGWFDTQGLRLRRGDRALAQGLKAWLARLEGDDGAATREARLAVALAEECGQHALECLARSHLALLLAEAQDTRGSQAQLRSAQMLLLAWPSPLLQGSVSLAQARLAQRHGQQAEALTALGQALALDREHGLAFRPGWASADLADLCALALQHDVEPEQARRWVRDHQLVPREPPLRVPGWPWAIRLHTLGRFAIEVRGAPVEFSGKGPGRPAELLKLLLALGGQSVRLYQLSDALWPHVDADYAHKSFTAALHRLRRLLEHDEALLLRDGRLSLNPALVWTDTAALEQVLASIEDSIRAPGAARRTDPALRVAVHEALALYRGPFLPDESEQPGYIAWREQLRARLLRCVTRVARHWEEADDHETAADFYLALLQADPLFEAPYRNLMLSHQRRGDADAAREVYERLRTTLALRLKTMPSAQTQALYVALDGPAPRAA